MKWIAICSMFIDHIGKIPGAQLFLMDQFGMGMAVSYDLLQVMGILGRIAFPIFAFGIAQGCKYTRNISKYILRLLICGVVSEVPYQLFFNDGIVYFGVSNILFTLTLGAIGCYFIRLFKENDKLWVSIITTLVLMFIAEVVHVEAGAMGVLLIVATYYFFDDRKKRTVSMALILTFMYLVSGYFIGFTPPFVQWLLPNTNIWLLLLNVVGALSSVLLLCFYNGEKGKTYLKYMFYVFYPVHLIVLFGVSRIM